MHLRELIIPVKYAADIVGSIIHTAYQILIGL